MEQCVSYKYLGIHIDEKLTWKAHINYLCEKVSKMCGLFSKLRHCCNKELLRVVYFALVESHLQYCNIIWGNASERILAPLVKLQEKIIRIMSFASTDQSNSEYFFNALKILNLNQLNKLAKAKFIYKYRNNKLPSSFDSILTPNTNNHTYALRSLVTNDFKCVWGKSNFGMKMLQYQGAQLWKKYYG